MTCRLAVLQRVSRLNVPITTNLVCRSRAVPSACACAQCAQCAQLLWCRGLQGWKSSVPQLSPWLGSLLAAHRCTAPPQHYRCPGPRPAAVRWCCCANPGFDVNCCKKCILTKMFASTCVASRLGYQSGCWRRRGENGKMEFLIWLVSALITCACILNDETLNCRNVIQAWNLLLN